MWISSENDDWNITIYWNIIASRLSEPKTAQSVRKLVFGTYGSTKFLKETCISTIITLFTIQSSLLSLKQFRNPIDRIRRILSTLNASKAKGKTVHSRHDLTSKRTTSPVKSIPNEGWIVDATRTNAESDEEKETAAQPVRTCFLARLAASRRLSRLPARYLETKFPRKRWIYAGNSSPTIFRGRAPFSFFLSLRLPSSRMERFVRVVAHGRRWNQRDEIFRDFAFIFSDFALPFSSYGSPGYFDYRFIRTVTWNTDTDLHKHVKASQRSQSDKG